MRIIFSTREKVHVKISTKPRAADTKSAKQTTSFFLQSWFCCCNKSNRWVFPKIGVPQWMVKIRENPIKMDDLGGPPLFLETPRWFFLYSKNSLNLLPLKVVCCCSAVFCSSQGCPNQALTRMPGRPPVDSQPVTRNLLFFFGGGFTELRNIPVPPVFLFGVAKRASRKIILKKNWNLMMYRSWVGPKHLFTGGFL